MNPMVMMLAMSAGQGPPGGYPVSPGYYPVVPVQAAPSAPAVLPGTIPMPMTAQPGVGMPPATPSVPATPAAPSTTNGNGNGECPTCEEEKDEGPPVYLLERSLRETWLGKKMADNNLRLYGWTAMNYSVSTASTSNLPMTFNDQPNRYQMNQNWIHFEKALDTSKKERQWGFVTDWILPGTDARFTVARGLFNGQSGDYPIDLYQAYVQVYLPNIGGEGTTVKIGRFQTIIGNELVQAVDTPFVSKSYLFQYNPFTHTGAFATTQLNDTWSVGNGLVLGADNFIDPASRLAYLGQIRWAPPEGKTSVAFNTMVTAPTYDVAEEFPFYNVYNLLLTRNFGEKLTYIADATFSHMNGVPGVGGTTWYGLANYFIYKFTDQLAGTVRAEVFEDSDGVRTGYSGLYTEVTTGVAWSPKPGVIFRPSVRYDYNNRSRPFDGDASMWTAAFEMILRW